MDDEIQIEQLRNQLKASNKIETNTVKTRK
jgi:hypothetical protein